MHTLDILIDLKAQTGKGSMSRKMDILEANRDNKELKNFFYWCLEPTINYWQSKIDLSPKYVHREIGGAYLTIVMEQILKDLVTRKITGNAAKAHLTSMYCELEPKDAELLSRIITRKPDVGFNVSTVNKVWPNLIYDVPYMRCSGYSPKMVKSWDFKNDMIYSQLKADGMYNNVIITDKINLETRTGENLQLVVDKLTPLYYDTTLYAIRDSLGEDVVLHGELNVCKHEIPIERSKSNGMINKVKLGGDFPKDTALRITVWDYIPLSNYKSHEEYEVPYSERIKRLRDSFEDSNEIQLIETRHIYSPMEAQQHFVECLQRGLEGTVVKHGSLTWKYHTSTKQLKLKNKFRFEMRITGFKPGTGKFEPTFGSVGIESECGLLKSSISGMTQKVREDIHAERDYYKGGVAEIEAAGLFKAEDGSYGLMHPQWKGFRGDRTEADTLERIIQQEIDSILGKGMNNE